MTENKSSECTGLDAQKNGRKGKPLKQASSTQKESSKQQTDKKQQELPEQRNKKDN